MDKLTINSGSGYKVLIENKEATKIEITANSVISGDVISREEFDASLALISAEQNSRQDADAALQAQIDDKADKTALDNQVGLEADARIAGDAALQTQIDTIYKPGGGSVTAQNAVYENGVLHYTGGTVSTPFGDLNGCSLTVPADTQLTLGYQPATLVSGQALVYLWHTSADAAAALADHISNGNAGLSIIAQPNGFYIRVDGASSGSLADPGPSVVSLAGRRLQIDVPGVPNASYETPETVGQAPAYLHIFSINMAGNSDVADAAFELSPSSSASAATGLLPDETAARIAGDSALSADIASVQTLAQINQLNITEKADQVDLDLLTDDVIQQGIQLANKADITALNSLATEVNTKATIAQLNQAISDLVDGAPEALNTLRKIAEELADDQTELDALLVLVNQAVSFAVVQSLSSAQKTRARENIGAEEVGVAASLVNAITPASIGAATSVQGVKADTALQSEDMAPVAFSGAYSALTGLPTIPGLSSSTPAAPTTTGSAGTATTSARGDHAHPLPSDSQITSALLTGLATGPNAAIAAADSILQALEKLQAQASANATSVSTNSALVASASGKIGPSWYVSGSLYDNQYPRQVGVSTGTITKGQVTFVPRQILEDATFTSLSFYCTGQSSGAVGHAGIYSDDNGKPGTLLASFSADCSTPGIKEVAVSLTLSAGQIVWDACLLTGGVGNAQFYLSSTTRALPQQSGATVNSFVGRYLNGQSALPTNPTAPLFSQTALMMRLLLKAQ